MAEEFEQTLQNTVPSAIAPNSGGMDTQSFIEELNKPLGSPALMGAAMTPVSGAHAMAVPSSFARPIEPFQGAPLDHREVVGHKNARAQGIGNAITGTANFIGSVVTAEARAKQDHTRDAATKVIMAQQGIDEATAQKESAEAMMKNSTGAEYDAYKATADKATATIAQNTKVRDGVFADPKMRKSLQKGFDISYTDPSSNKTEHHAAVMEAIKNAKSMQEKKQAIQQLREKENQQASAGMGAAFAAQQPQGTAPNQLAKQQVAAYQQQRKDAVETYKAMGPIYAEQLRAKGAVTVEGMRSATDLRKAAIDAAAKVDEQVLKNKQAGLDNEAARSLEGMRNANARALELLRQGNPIEVLKSFNDAQKNYETSITENQKSRQALNNELDKASSSRGAEIRRQLQAIDASDEQAKNAFTLNRNVIAKGLNVSVDDPRLAVPTVHVGEGAGNAANSGSSSSTVSTDLDPRTGKPWKSSVSAAYRLIIKAHYGAGILSHDASQTVDSINRGVRKIERFFDSDKTASN